MKRQLLEGKESILKSPEKEIKQMFPLDVKKYSSEVLGGNNCDRARQT